ncbi:MAG: DNA-formamidopyrimidine glycosylase [Cyanobium sp.]|nr:DNA-formamidopyrimidine glycosylase [Cyanobium sp.]
MPELPEVETVRRGLERQTLHRRIQKLLILRPRVVASPADPADFMAALLDCSLVAWRRRGKYLIGELQRQQRPAGYWGVHLRMTGQFLLIDANRAAAGAPPCRHTRMRIWTDDGNELRFVDMRSFGQMWWVPPAEPLESVITGMKRLGPEPFSEKFTTGHLQTALQGSQRPIKSALLDQSLVAGVGNIYADESLFAAGIRPDTPSGQLDQDRLHKLQAALVDVLRRSIGAGGTTFSDFRDLTGTNGNYGGVALVYRRTGLPCRRCGTPIERYRLGGRSSHWCPGCQH